MWNSRLKYFNDDCNVDEKKQELCAISNADRLENYTSLIKASNCTSIDKLYSLYILYKKDITLLKKIK
jgi:hypothetical protein